MKNPTLLKPGESQHTIYYSSVLKKKQVQYDYRDSKGRLFSTVADSVEKAKLKIFNQIGETDRKEAEAEHNFFKSHPELNP